MSNNRRHFCLKIDNPFVQVYEIFMSEYQRSSCPTAGDPSTRVSATICQRISAILADILSFGKLSPPVCMLINHARLIYLSRIVIER